MTSENDFTHVSIRAGGFWLALASVVMASALAMHGPIAPEPLDQMTKISQHAMAWLVAHWLAAVALSFYAVAGIIMLGSRSRLTAQSWTLSAWAVIVVGALWTVDTAVVEATAVTDAAVSGRSETFVTWMAFAEGKANGFSFVALALSVIAAREARADAGVTPSWAATAAVFAGVGAFAGWALGMWFDVGVGAIIWLAGSILVTAWAAWFGGALSRT